jgi:hypothetical protein
MAWQARFETRRVQGFPVFFASKPAASRRGKLSPARNGKLVSKRCGPLQRRPMDHSTLLQLGWAVVIVAVGGLIGIGLVLLAAAYLPRLLDRLTPNIDEGKEIARGNLAVAQYFGLVVAGSIVGLSIVIAAAVLGGIIAALY